MQSAGDIGYNVTADFSVFRQEFEKARADTERHAGDIKHHLEGLHEVGEKVSETMRGLATAFLGAFTIERFIDTVKEAVTAAGELNNVAAQMGISTQAVQQYAFAAAETGVRQEVLNGSITRFSRFIGEAMDGNRQQIELLNRWGLRILDASGHQRNLNAILADFADIVQRTTSPQERAAEVFAAMGRGAAPMIDLLSRGSTGLRQFAAEADHLGVVLDQQTIDRAHHFNAELEVLELRLKAAAVQPFLDFVSQISSYVRNSVTEFNNLLDAINHVIARAPSLPGAGGGFNPFAGITGGDSGIPLLPLRGVGDAIRNAVTAPPETPEEVQVRRLRTQIQATIQERDRMMEMPATPENQGAWEQIINRLIALNAQLREAEVHLEEMHRSAAATAAAMPHADDHGAAPAHAATPGHGMTMSVTAAGLQIEGGGRVGFGGGGASNPPARIGESTADRIQQVIRTLQEQLRDINNPEDNAVDQWLRRLPRQANQEQRDQVQRLAEKYAQAQEERKAWNEAESEGARIADSARTNTERLHDRLTDLNFLYKQGHITVEEYGRATRDAWLAVPEIGRAADDLGKAFSTAFHDAITGAKSLRDVLGGLLQDIGNIFLKIAVEEPLAAALRLGLGSAFNWAFGPTTAPNGGIGVGPGHRAMGGIDGPFGPIAMAGGGIVDSPHAVIFGEGDSPEAFVPVPAGKIPVDLRGGGGGGDVHITNHIDARNADPGAAIRIAQAIDIAVARARAVVFDDLRRRGPIRREIH